MKLKKILSGFLAGAIAVTSFVVTSVTAGAAEDVWEETTIDGKKAWTYAVSSVIDETHPAPATAKLDLNASEYYPGDLKDVVAVTFDLKIEDGSGGGCLGGPDLAKGDWSNALEWSNGGSKVAKFGGLSDSGIQIQIWWASAGTKFTVSNVKVVDELVVDENEPDKWIELADGKTYKYTVSDTSKKETLKLKVDSGDLDNVLAVSADITVTGSASGGLGANVLGSSGWEQTEWSSTGTIRLNVDGLKYNTVDFMIWSLTAGTVITVTNFKVAYAVAIDDAEGGSVDGVSPAFVGETVTLTVTPDTGYELDTLTIKKTDGTEVDAEGDVIESETGKQEWRFTMPASAVTVTATFKALAATLYEINSGSVTNGHVFIGANGGKAAAGETVTVTVSPAEGYELDTISVKKTDGTVVSVTASSEEGEYTFVMPASAVTVTVTFVKAADPDAEKYTVSVLSALNGSVSIVTGSGSAAEAEYAEGRTVTISVAPAAGFALDELKVYSGSSSAPEYVALTITKNDADNTKNGTTYAFTMPAKNVYVYSSFEALPEVNAFDKENFEEADEPISIQAPSVNGKHTDIGAVLISADDAKNYKGYNVIAKVKNGSGVVVKVSKPVFVSKAYKSVTFNGETMSYDTSFVVLITVKNIPDGYTVEYEFEGVEA